jgi:FkbM family methyltransferase
MTRELRRIPGGLVAAERYNVLPQTERTRPQGVMAANSRLRRAIKRILHPVLGEGAYAAVQSVAVTWDLVRGNWTEPSIALLDAAIRPGETVVDVGANFGLFAYYLSRAVGKHGRVYAFEPIQYSRRILKNVKSLCGLRNVEIMAMACGERRGEIEMVAPLQGSGAISAGLAHFAGRNGPSAEDNVDGRHYLVPVGALDDIREELGSVSLIKCDVEGAELFVLRGARQILKTSRPTVLCELVPEYLHGFGVEHEDIAAYFRELGYDAFDIESVAGRAQLTRTDFSEPGNYVFVHPERAERFAELVSTSRDAMVGQKG